MKLSGDVDASKINNTTITLKTAKGTAVTTTVAYDATSKTATITLPAGVALDVNSDYVLTVGTETGLAEQVTSSFKTADALVVTSSTPVEATDSNATNITLNFNKVLDGNTINTTNIKLQDTTTGQYIPVTVALVAGSSTAVTVSRTDGQNFNANANISYKLTLSTNVKALDGTGFTEAYVLNFFDVSNITLTANATYDNASNVYGKKTSSTVGTALRYTATFNQDMNGATINTDTVKLVKVSDNTEAPIEVAYDAGGRSVTVTLKEDLQDLTAYELRFAKDIKNAQGVALTDPINRRFTVGDWTAPTLEASTPANGATGFNVSPLATQAERMVLTFSEPVTNLVRATAASFTDGGNGAIQLTFNGQVATGGGAAQADNTALYDLFIDANGNGVYDVATEAGSRVPVRPVVKGSSNNTGTTAAEVTLYPDAVLTADATYTLAVSNTITVDTKALSTNSKLDNTLVFKAGSATTGKSTTLGLESAKYNAATKTLVLTFDRPLDTTSATKNALVSSSFTLTGGTFGTVQGTNFIISGNTATAVLKDEAIIPGVTKITQAAVTTGATDPHTLDSAGAALAFTANEITVE